MSEEIPCKQDPSLKANIDLFADVLKSEAHTLSDLGMSESEFYQSGIFEGAIQRVRGQISASMAEKKNFVRNVLNHMQDNKFIQDWMEAGNSNRHDYTVTLNDSRVAAIELKGCLDGNNTNISIRPPHAHEFILWSICQNKGADPRHNLWSGIHTRISADIVADQKRIDGLVVWDWLCNTAARKCPKVTDEDERAILIGPYTLPPPCIYLFPATVPSPRNNPDPTPHKINTVGFLAALNECFGGKEAELNYVRFKAEMAGTETTRSTTIIRDGHIVRQSNPTPIRRE
jgi:hypothetical protein